MPAACFVHGRKRAHIHYVVFPLLQPQACFFVSLTPHAVRPSLRGQLSLFVGSSAFSGPVSRRDAFKTFGAGLGAAAAASVAAPSFATQTANDVQQNYQARLNEARAKEFGNPYAKIAASATAATKVEIPGGAFYSNGKSENGVSYRSPNDPNACSEVCGLTQNTEASSRPDPLRPIRLCSLTLRLCVLSSCLCRRRASSWTSRSARRSAWPSTASRRAQICLPPGDHLCHACMPI